MILAAGFGTRLKPLTDTLPKALIEYKGCPMIAYQIDRLKEAGIKEIIVNVHHHPEKMIEYISNNDFGVDIKLSLEDGEILGTGGGIIHAKDFFSGEDYFAVVNVDIDTNFNIKQLMDYAEEIKPFSAIAVQKRNTRRGLVFDDQMNMTGLQKEDSPAENVYAFNCMHVISGDVFRENLDVRFCGVFDIYLEMIQRGKTIVGYDVGNASFKDLGKMENLN